MLLTAAITVAAGAGVVCRHILDEVVQHRTAGEFPYGTFLINLSRSLLLGAVLGLSAGSRPRTSRAARS